MFFCSSYFFEVLSACLLAFGGSVLLDQFTCDNCYWTSDRVNNFFLSFSKFVHDYRYTRNLRGILEVRFHFWMSLKKKTSKKTAKKKMFFFSFSSEQTVKTFHSSMRFLFWNLPLEFIFFYVVFFYLFFSKFYVPQHFEKKKWKKYEKIFKKLYLFFCFESVKNWQRNN